MKKRKNYEISVIDKTYSKTISDETKFYTSDTALELVFKLKETEYTFESAEIVLLNIDDRSLVTRPVAKVLGSFTYELEDDITAHYGEWSGQLRFEQGGEIYVSSPVKFRIENDLGNERPPQLSDVQSWVNLKRYADGLTEDLKQAVEEAVAKVETMDDTFKANEIDRDKAEKERQARFEDVESERDETFNTNESARQTQELEREKAEASRQTVFDGNEANRTETFNTNEATRQENETVRQQAETERASAESSRVSAEEQRIAKDSERDSKIEEIERVATEPLKPIHTLKVENEVFSSDEVSVSEGVITINNHNLKVGDKVAFVATATSYNVNKPFEGAMRLNTVYYVVNVSSDSFQISTTQNGEPIVFNIDTKGFLWQFEKVNVRNLEVRGLDGTEYRVVFTGDHDGNSASRRLISVYTNPGNVGSRYSTKDLQHTITATDINPVHGVMDIYSEMIFKVINRKILITVDSSFTTIGATTYNHSEETYSNRIVTRTNNPMVGFQDSIRIIGVSGQHLFDGSTLEVYEV